VHGYHKFALRQLWIPRLGGSGLPFGQFRIARFSLTEYAPRVRKVDDVIDSNAMRPWVMLK
jgi:hypothetical protein